MPATAHVIVDDRLLIEELLIGIDRPSRTILSTTGYWYFRACRAAVAGSGGHLSGPFGGLPVDLQAQAVLSLLELPAEVGLTDPRVVIPEMAQIALRHDRLNVLNLEAVAAARVSGATVWLTPPSAAGVLPAVLDAEGCRWEVVPIG